MKGREPPRTGEVLDAFKALANLAVAASQPAKSLRERFMTAPGTTREHVIDVYRRRAKRYDLVIYLYYLLGAREWAYRRRALQALRLHPVTL